MENERLPQRLDIACASVTISFPGVEVAQVPLGLLLVIVVAQALLEECGDGVGDALQFLVALLLGCLQTTIDMSSDEGHRNGIAGRTVSGEKTSGLGGWRRGTLESDM